MFNLVVIMTSSESFLTFKEVQEKLEKDYPGEIRINSYDTTELDNESKVYQACVEETEKADFVLMNLHGSLSFFKKFHPYFNKFEKEKKFFIYTTIEEEVKELLPRSGIMTEDFRKIYQYYKSSGFENIFNLTKYLSKRFGNLALDFEEPFFPKWSGIYDPDEEIKSEDQYLEKIRQKKGLTVGIIINVMLIQKNNLAHIDALFRKIKEQGATPLCVYSDMAPDQELGCEGIRNALERCMLYRGETIVDSIINTTAFSLSILSDPGDGSKPKENSVFELFGVPVFQGMTTLQSYEEWRDSVKGLDGLSLSWSVFQPEFDGQMITYPIATTEKIETKHGSQKISAPIKDRIEYLTRLAINWANLRHKKNSEKKVAIILHNNPPRNDNIGGAAGLDTPASVYDMVNCLKETDFSTAYDFKDGEDLIGKIISGLTNDGRWSSPEDMLEKSIDTVTKAQYQRWYDNFSSKNQENLVKYWGQPVGEFMTVDQQLLVPGILNGNVFIGLQPPRAFEEQAEELFHSTDIPCPHQYIAFYDWVEKIFKADVIIHVGTHGTIEWLPGKEVGLSKDCYSDICIGTIPHLYMYIINAPGEGSAAKRRTYPSLVDHMIPSMVQSGVYEELEEMDDLMKQYYHVKSVDPKKIPIVEKQILELAERINLHQDLDMTKEEMAEDVEASIKQFHSWISKVQACDISDGLHIFGMVPKDKRLRNMLKVLVRNRNGDTLSLRNSLCDFLGLDFEALLAAPEQETDDGKSYGILLAEVDEMGEEIFQVLEEKNYDSREIENIIQDFKKEEEQDEKSLRACLEFVCTFIKPRVDKINEEMKHLIGGVHGQFVPPGPSGAPTRGNAAILPTGRNFYSVDPGAMPSRFSWENGKILGNQILQRYLDDEGKYPESVSILVYATEAMRTYGDDIAETFFLLGVRPVWLGNTDRVIGIEAIPMSELNRPRIDVTLRITGLFRDAFPNLIERVEDAVNLVSALDEDDEINFVKKHVDEEIAELVKNGVNQEEAKEQSLLRVFGDPPGAYGAGVNWMVESKKWNDVTDLGKVYTNWGCHAYGKKFHGEKMPEVFSRRMSKINAAIKNESTREVDMLDSDDFYNYFGGMVAAITTHSGEQKPAFVPSTSDQDHIETLSLHEEASRVMRARVNNPKWIEGLKEHGYDGAKQVSSMVDFTFGLDATTDVIDDWMYDSISERYAFNQENSDWMRQVNPWALHNVAERLLEAHQRGMWNASEDKVDKLKEIYLEMEGTFEEME